MNCALILFFLSAIAGTWAILSPKNEQHPVKEALKTSRLGSRIIGGGDATISEHPYIVSLRLPGVFYCAGVILDNVTILTSAHCMGNDVELYTIEYGTGIHEHGFVVNLDSFVIHPNFSHPDASGTFPNDIAVLNLSSPMQMSESAQPIKISNRTNDELARPESSLCTILGWGATSEANLQPTTTLHKADVHVITDTACSNSWPNHICDSCHICVTGGDWFGRPCYGDGGGPLVCNGELVGVMSWLASGCPATIPYVYTEVRSYISWINSVWNP